MKIYIIGCPGAGKTTLSKLLSKKYNINYYELDCIVYDDNNNHIKRSDKEIKKIFDNIINKDSWIIEDVGRNKFNNGLDKCDIIYYLKVPKIKVYYQIIKRWIKQRLNIEHYNYPPTIKQLINYFKITTGYFKKESSKLEKLNKYKDKVIYLYNKDIKHMSNNVYHKK